jgi:hypothetical protein
MSLFDEKALRDIVADEVRRVLREERAGYRRPANDGEYLPVAEAAGRAAVAPATIRTWMAQGKLGRYHAGRELRVLWSELATLMRKPPKRSDDGETDRATPEEEAALYLRRRQKRAT